MRLPITAIYYPIMLISLIAMGVGYQNKWAWPAIVIVGYGFAGFQLVAVPAVTLAFAIDSYPQIAGEILLTGTLVKNTFGFGISFWLPDWLIRDGSFLDPIMVFFAISAFFGLMTWPMYIWGKKLRRLTAKSNVHLTETEM